MKEIRYLLLFLVGFWASDLWADQMVVPPEQTDRFGDIQDPLLRLGRSMHAYEGSLFSGASGNLLNLKGISFRLDENFTLHRTVIYDSINIYLSTLPRPLSQFSIAPELNRGDDRTLVFSGRDVQFTTAPSSDPGTFQVSFPFTTFFQYNRFSGPLVLEMEHETRVLFAGPIVDAQAGQNFRRLNWGNPGTVEGFAPVLLLDYTIVPEPINISFTIVLGAIFLLTRSSARQ